MKAKRAEREAREMNEAEELARRIGKLRSTFTLETGETGKAFGSITAQDLVKRIKNELGNEIDRHRVSLEHPIKTTGEHEVSIKLHHDVMAKFKFTVKSTHRSRSLRNRKRRQNRRRRSAVSSARQTNKINAEFSRSRKRRTWEASQDSRQWRWPRLAAQNGGRVFPTSPTASSQDIHRTPPHSVEAEQGVLGSMLISPREIIAECVEKINEEYFYVPAHQTIYIVLVELWNAGQGIDLITFTQVLRDRNVLETVGGAAFVTSLFTFVPTAANVGYYLEIVRDKYILRQIIAPAPKACGAPTKSRTKWTICSTKWSRKFSPSAKIVSKARCLTMKDQVMDAIEAIERLYERHGGITGISTGFAELDRMTSGLHRPR